MPKFLAVRKSDDAVLYARTRSTEQAAKWPPDHDTYLVEVSDPIYEQISSGTLYDGSQLPRFRWNGSALDIIPDPRPVLTFTPAIIDAEVGDDVAVTLTLNGRTNETVEFQSEFGIPLRVTFSGGVAAVSIDTSKPMVLRIGPSPAFAVAEPLTVRVFGRALGRLI